MTGPTRAVDVPRTMVAPKSFPALGLDGSAIIAMHHFVLSTPKTVACLTLLINAPFVTFLGPSLIAPKAAPMNRRVTLPSVVV